MAQPEAVLITGVYGSGKSTVLEQMADIIESHGLHYAALDLDWLEWGWPGDDPDQDMAEHRLMLENLELVVGTYLRRGNDRFLMSHSIRSAEELDMLKAVVRMPVRTVRLDVPLEEIRRRLAPNPTTGRAGDLATAEGWLAAGDGVGIEDLTVAGDRPVGDVAMEILSWLGWLEPDRR